MRPPKVIHDGAWEYGQWDVAYWAEVYLGIKMHPGQIEFANAYLKRTASGWRALYLWIMVSAGNRAGKTAALAIVILHSVFYKMGIEFPTTRDAPRANTPFPSSRSAMPGCGSGSPDGLGYADDLAAPAVRATPLRPVPPKSGPPVGWGTCGFSAGSRAAGP